MPYYASSLQNKIEKRQTRWAFEESVYKTGFKAFKFLNIIQNTTKI